MPLTECDNCGAVRPEEELEEPADLWERLDPGSEVPAGECPDCGALAYLTTLTSRRRKAMPLPHCPTCDAPPTGTCETLTGVALIHGLDADGEIEYSGETKIDWDNQTTNRDEEGRIEWWCAGCCESFFAAHVKEETVTENTK